MIFFSQVIYLLKLAAKNLNWIYNSFRVKAGANCRFGFPIAFEGRGKLILGNSCKLSSNCTFRYSDGSTLELGNNGRIAKRTNISVTARNSLTIGNDFSIGEGVNIYVHGKWTLGEQVTIASNCQIFAREPNSNGKLIIGNGSAIGDYSIIDISEDVIIGNNVALGPRCTIYTHDHNYKEVNIVAPWKGSPVKRPVIINNGAWIGSNVLILPGVVIGENAIVAASSVVTKNIPANCIYGGVPAKDLRKIKS